MSKTCEKRNTKPVEKSAGPVASGPLEIPFQGVRAYPITSEEGLAKTLDSLRRAAYEASVLQVKFDADMRADLQRVKATRLAVVTERGAEGSIELGQYISQLATAIEAYGLEMDTETVDGPDGKVSRRTNPDILRFGAVAGPDDGPATPKEGEKQATNRAWGSVVSLPVPDSGESAKVGAKVKASVVEKTLRAVIFAALRAAGLDRFWKVSLAPDIASAKSAYQKGEISAEDLGKQGLEVVPGVKRVDLSVTGADLKSVRAFFEV